MAGYRGLAAAVAISLALHAGADAILPRTHPAQSAQPAQQLKPTPLVEPPAQHKAELPRFDEEQRQYAAELLDTLNRGEKVRLSEFLIKSETLGANIALAAEGRMPVDENAMRLRYAETMEEAKDAVANKPDKVQAMHKFLHGRLLKAYFHKNGDLVDVLETGWYNCASSTKIFTALLEDLGIENSPGVLVFDDHLASYVLGRRIDAVAKEWEEAVRNYDGCGLIAPRDIFIAAYLTKLGMGKTLPPGLASLYNAQKRWRGCPATGKTVLEGGVENSGFPATGVLSGLSIPEDVIPNQAYKPSAREVAEMGRGLLAAYFISNPKDPAGYAEVDAKDTGIQVKPVIIPDGADWAFLLNIASLEFALSTITPPGSTKACCSPIRSIPPRTIPDLIEYSYKNGNHRFEYYRPANICARYKKAAESGDHKELEGYVKFNFCPEVEQALKDRYARAPGIGGLIIGLGMLGYRRNFDFLAEQLKAPDYYIQDESAWALVATDRGRACQLLRAMPRDKPGVSDFPLVYGCLDQESSLRNIRRYLDNPPAERYSLPTSIDTALWAINGASLAASDYGWLKSAVPHLPFGVWPQLARIFHEHGDKGFALELMRKVAAGTDKEELLPLCGLPEDFNPLLVTFLSDQRYAHVVAQGMICNGGYGAYLPEITASLRKRAADMGSSTYRRVLSAFILLRLGIDPLGND